MDTQTMIATLEKSFEQKKENKPTTLAEAVSNELMKIMPRISDELFERKREAKIQLTQEQVNKISDFYWKSVKRQHGWASYDWIKPTYSCIAQIPLFSCAPIETPEISYKNTAKILFEEKYHFDSNALPNERFFGLIASHSFGAEIKAANCFYTDKKVGHTIIECQTKWEAPFLLDACVKVPKLPESITEIKDEAFLKYYTENKKQKRELGLKSIVKEPTLSILWAPTDEALYARGQIHEPLPQPVIIQPRKDPALLLEITDGEKTYKHIIATWNIGEEKPYKNWLAEYSEGSK